MLEDKNHRWVDRTMKCPLGPVPKKASIAAWSAAFSYQSELIGPVRFSFPVFIRLLALLI